MNSGILTARPKRRTVRISRLEAPQGDIVRFRRAVKRTLIILSIGFIIGHWTGFQVYAEDSPKMKTHRETHVQIPRAVPVCQSIQEFKPSRLTVNALAKSIPASALNH